VKQHQDILPYALSAIAGLAVCLTIASISNRNEAWDGDLYYSVGIPIMALIIFIISYLFPQKPWRWTLSMAAGQFMSALINGSSLSLWPLAIIFMTVISVPQFIAGYLGAKLKTRNQTEN
jgi:hypothetical protein